MSKVDLEQVADELLKLRATAKEIEATVQRLAQLVAPLARGGR